MIRKCMKISAIWKGSVWNKDLTNKILYKNNGIMIQKKIYYIAITAISKGSVWNKTGLIKMANNNE